MVQLISYDLRKPGRDYAKLYDAIKSLDDGYWHRLESVWMVRTQLGSGAVRDFLKQHIDANDQLLVIRVGMDWATTGLSSDCNDWLRRNVAA